MSYHQFFVKYIAVSGHHSQEIDAVIEIRDLKHIGIGTGLKFQALIAAYQTSGNIEDIELGDIRFGIRHRNLRTRHRAFGYMLTSFGIGSL